MMNYRKLLSKLIDKGYIEAPEGSKLERVGRKVARARNRQACGGVSYRPRIVEKRDPIYLSAISS